MKNTIKSVTPTKTKTTVGGASAPTEASATTATTRDADSRRAMIAEAAYYLYLQRDCTAGSEQADWLSAEQEIDRLLAAPSIH